MSYVPPLRPLYIFACVAPVAPTISLCLLPLNWSPATWSKGTCDWENHFFPIILYSLSCPQLATYPPTLSALNKEMGRVGKKYFSIVQICKPVGSCFPTYFCCLCLFAKNSFLKTTQHSVVVLRVNFHPDWARYCTLLVPLCR